VLTYLVIVLLNFGPLVAFVLAFGWQGLMTMQPSLAFWLGAAAAFWLVIGAVLCYFGFRPGV